MIINLVGFFRVPKVAPKMHQPPFLRTSTGVFFAQRKKSVDLHFLLHRHKACRASPSGVACAACFEALAYVFASADASLRILMTPRQKNERFFAMVCQFKYGFSLSRCPQELEIFYTRTAAGEVRQASCSKRLRKVSNRLFHLSRKDAIFSW